MRGSPRLGFPGATVATLTPTAEGDPEGMSRNWPWSRSTGTRAGSAAGSRPLRNASVMAATAAAGPSLATATASTYLTAVDRASIITTNPRNSCRYRSIGL